MHDLHINLKPSTAFLVIQLLMLAGSLVSIFCVILPYYMQFLLALTALSYSVWVIWGTGRLRAPRAILQLVCHENNAWQIKERSGDTYPASLCGDSTVTSHVSILRFKRQDRSRAQRCCVIFRDALDAQSYRRMLMLLHTMKIH